MKAKLSHEINMPVFSFDILDPVIKAPVIKENMFSELFLTSDAKYTIGIFQCLLLVDHTDPSFSNDQRFSHGALGFASSNQARFKGYSKHLKTTLLENFLVPYHDLHEYPSWRQISNRKACF